MCNMESCFNYYYIGTGRTQTKKVQDKFTTYVKFVCFLFFLYLGWRGLKEERRTVTIRPPAAHQRHVRRYGRLKRWRQRCPAGQRTATGHDCLRSSYCTSSSTFRFWTGLMPPKCAASGTRLSTCQSCGDVLSLSSTSQPAPTLKPRIQTWSNRS